MVEQTVTQQLPPQNLDAEQAALGAMLLEREAIMRAEEILRPDDFYREGHRWIFRGILALYRDSQPVDLITLGEWLQTHTTSGQPATADDNLLSLVGGGLYLTTLMQSAPTAAGITQYAGIVRAKSLQRQLINAADEVMQASYQGDCDLDALITQTEQRIRTIADRGHRTNFSDSRIGRLMEIEFNRMDDEAVNGVPIQTGLFSNLESLNEILYPGLEKGTVLIVAGSTSTGKTTVAMSNFAWPCAISGGHVLFLSCEMAQKQIAMRSFVSLGAASGWQMQTKSRLEYWSQFPGGVPIGQSLANTVAEIYHCDLCVLYTPTLTPSQALALGRAKARDGGLDMLIIDGLWLMRPDRRMESRRIELEETMRAMKRIAGELMVPIVMMHQLSRIKDRPDKRPVLEDLRESGEIEQSADQVLFAYRPAFADPNNTRLPESFLPGNSQEFRWKAWQHYAEFLLRKNRNGEPGTSNAYFDKEHVRFVEWTQHYSAVEAGGAM